MVETTSRLGVLGFGPCRLPTVFRSVQIAERTPPLRVSRLIGPPGFMSVSPPPAARPDLRRAEGWVLDISQKLRGHWERF
jgi:hypothetical protein